ncbi:MAG TPA: hypothetical protein ENJ18_06365 [Nannocystis exedens]|nr:hypothetical protein [Nannocystis exedens]
MALEFPAVLALLRECILFAALALPTEAEGARPAPVADSVDLSTRPGSAGSVDTAAGPGPVPVAGSVDMGEDVVHGFAEHDPRRCDRSTPVGRAAAEAAPPSYDCGNYRRVKDQKTGEERLVFRKHRFVGVPQILQDPAFGTMFGLRARYVKRRPGTRLDRVQLDLAARISTLKVQDHDLRLQLRDLLGRNEMIFVLGAIDVNPTYPYLGVANNKPLIGVDFRDPYYTVKLRTFAASLVYAEPAWMVPATADHPPGFLRWFVGATFAVDRFEPYEDSLFAKERPEEVGLQRRGYFVGGLQWDRRDNEWHPTTGALHEASWTLAGPWAGGSRSWSRFSLLARWYRALGSKKIVFAQAAILDALIGLPPLIPLGQVGGLEPMDGLGGLSFGRGYYRRRFIGDTKAAVMTELRYTPINFKLLRWSVGLGVRAFVDVVKVFQANESLHANLHPSGGGGLYVLWDRFFVLRGDFGYSAEGAALYISGGHPF